MCALIFMQEALAGLRRINLESLRWRVSDAEGQTGVLGRFASQICCSWQRLAAYAPNRDDGDMCIVLNSKDLCLTGKKLTYRFYVGILGKYFHLQIALLLIELLDAMYIGHLKDRSLKDQMAKDPTEVIPKAVLRMLPRYKLRDA
ncbi:hypothetical protein RJ640_004801, partial [Escallonia rubra]